MGNSLIFDIIWSNSEKYYVCPHCGAEMKDTSEIDGHEIHFCSCCGSKRAERLVIGQSNISFSKETGKYE